MATEIGVWEIIEGKSSPIDTSREFSGDMEKDLEEWIKEYPTVISHDLLIIGEQTITKSGPLDFLALDKSGNLVIIELKRENYEMLLNKFVLFLILLTIILSSLFRLFFVFNLRLLEPRWNGV